MNLWAKRIGQLAVLPVALFFFSCQDEASLLGYKNPNPKFDASYVEIPIESSVLLLDSQRTSNFTFQNETNRLLLGQYVDDKFGKVSADAYSQIFTTTTAKLAAGVEYDSVSLQLQLDFYSYGSRDTSTTQRVSVYELDEDLKYAERRNYFNKSQALVKPSALGSKEFRVNPDTLDDYSQNRPSAEVLVNVTLDPAFGERIFASAINYRDVATTNDSTFKVFEEFIKQFKGLAVKTDGGDKMLGINPLSRVRVHFHRDTVKSYFDLSFSFVTNFSNIKSDRASTELAGLSQYSTDFFPADNMRYIQSGAGVYTKLDFAKFFEFCDTVPNVIITSAQLTFGSVQESNLPPPSNLALRVLQDDSHLKKIKSLQDTLDLGSYNPRFAAHSGTLTLDNGSVVDNDQGIAVLGDQTPYLVYSSDKDFYTGNYALFFQQLSIVREDVPRFRYFAIYPATPSRPNTKSVNRVIFPKDGIKLKIYYTKPTTPVN